MAWVTGHQLRLYNSLGRLTEDFAPSADVVGLYSCGPTVYSYQHLGNMRPYVFADTLRRALRWKGIPVRHVVNITDVGHAVADSDTGEDKLELAAAKERRSVEEIAEFYAQDWLDALAALNVQPADVYPRASAYVDQMIEFAKVLEDKGYTYELPSGLYFDTSKSPGYGTLALLDLAGQRETGRVEHVEGRRHNSDFALWRAEEPGVRRIMRWNSPWGWGAPGWHLECSVMSMTLLGAHFDIHTGGIDHRELHHVNEIAQSEAYLEDDRPWVRYWLHNEFILLDAQKIAKSAGHTLRLADLVESGYHPMAYRLFLLGGHYRSQVDFTLTAMDAAQARLRRLVARVAPLRPFPRVETLAAARSLLGVPVDATGAAIDGEAAVPDTVDIKTALAYLDAIDAAISTDLATPKLLATLQDALKDPGFTPDGLRVVVAAADALLGLRLDNLELAEVEQRRTAEDLAPDEVQEIERLVAERTQARAEKNWPRADEIRAELDALGVQVTDTPSGPTWQLR
ncbi:cysteine--tRNA ligase [Trebonia kvetii]|uniref:Cysteine--tRNA ligase n=1 Tax=Trebonia kvetii TaxID=2480626 RepID=A0A6P2C4M5_9ACTN|nr:cysteine--tRNA ligase [Trebonia kvetii]